MRADVESLRGQIDRDGFAIVPGVFTRGQTAELIDDLANALAVQSGADGSIRNSSEAVSAARNLLSAWPGAMKLARARSIAEAAVGLLGPSCGVVRGLFFDKPPGQSWALPWHKDLAIAVRRNDLPTTVFSRPRIKAGVPHVEAPESVLAAMLTMRIHLDDVSDDNGPLLVLPGSHRTGKRLVAPAGDTGIRPIHVAAGDVLLMHRLLTHSSGNAREDTRRHRRIVHLEFASTVALPDHYEWHDYLPVVTM